MIHNVCVPTFYMMVGLPGAGKSKEAESIYEHSHRDGRKLISIHSSDKLRAELFGDENCQENNQLLFTELHRRMKDDLSKGINVIYDATNINKKRRIAFLRELKNIVCYKVCILLCTPYDVCLQNNNNRKRKVPEESIRKMYMNFNPPDYGEGFDEIILKYYYGKNYIPEIKYNTYDFLYGKINACSINQENSHHRLSIGDHCLAAANYIIDKYSCDKNDKLYVAAMLHDCGKPFTKSRINARGIDDGECHYYQHHCVGAYDSFFYTKSAALSCNDRIYVANLIYYHMHPFTSWKQSERAKKRDITVMGLSMYQDLMRLHEADLQAH